MDRKTLGAVLGAAGLVLWFMPLVGISFGGFDGFQTGQNVGGIAYLLLFASFAYSVLSWMELHVPRVIAAGVAVIVCILLWMQAGITAARWGLYALLLVNVAGILLAVRDNARSGKALSS